MAEYRRVLAPDGSASCEGCSLRLITSQCSVQSCTEYDSDGKPIYYIFQLLPQRLYTEEKQDGQATEI